MPKEIPRPIDPKPVEREIEKQQRSNPYFALFHGDFVLLSNIKLFAPYTLDTINLLMRDGRIVGQPLLFPEKENDFIIYAR